MICVYLYIPMNINKLTLEVTIFSLFFIISLRENFKFFTLLKLSGQFIFHLLYFFLSFPSHMYVCIVCVCARIVCVSLCMFIWLEHRNIQLFQSPPSFLKTGSLTEPEIRLVAYKTANLHPLHHPALEFQP